MLDEASAIQDTVERIEVHPTSLELTFKSTGKSMKIAWIKPIATRKREVLGQQQQATTRPIRTEARTRLLKGLAQGRRWLDQLLEGKVAGVAALAKQHKVSEKTVRSTLSLAFLAPDIVQAFIDGTLPRGLGISQMTNLSPDWSEQRRQLRIG
jgi:site-specific DNA recombinase